MNNSITSSDITDSIFRTTEHLVGGADTNINLADAVPSAVRRAPTTSVPENLVKPPGAKFATYELPLEIEDIGMPVYLSGIIQLITVVILLSKKKMYQASISFFTIGLFMFTVHCVYAGKADKLGQFNPLCRNFSYLMILFPLINVILVLSSDYLKIWKYLKYSPGQMKVSLPHFKLNQEIHEVEDDVDEVVDDVDEVVDDVVEEI